MMKNGKSFQDLAMLNDKKISRYVRTCKIFAWLSRNQILARFPRKTNLELSRSCLLVKIKRCSKKCLSINDLGKIFQILHELIRSCMTWQGVSSFGSLGCISAFLLNPYFASRGMLIVNNNAHCFT